MLHKIILITGASGEIGSAVARIFAQQGYNLALTGYKNFDKLHQLQKELMFEYYIQVSIYPCDLTQINQIKKMSDYFIKELGSIDGYIHVAGQAHYGLIQDMSIEEFHSLFEINLYSAFYLSKIFLPYFMKNGKGRILHISSIWGNVGASMEVAYSSSKSAIHGFTKALAKEVAPSHIPVNALAPGMVDTKMNGHLSQEDIHIICNEIPFGIMATPREVGQMCLQIMESPLYLTGQIIQMDGGWF